MADWAVKVWLPFSFLEGNKFPNACGWVTFDPPVVVVFRSKGSPSFCPFFQLPCCKEQVRVTSRVFAIYFVGQHVPVFRVQALTEMISFHLLHMLQLNPSQLLQLKYLNLSWQAHCELSHILPASLLEGTELLTKGVKHHHHTVMLVQHLQDINQGSILS